MNKMFKEGVFGILNRILGFIFLTIIAVAAAWVLAVLISFVINLPAFHDINAIKEFTGGPFYRFFNNYNPVELLLSF